VALSGAGPALVAFSFGPTQPVAAAMCAAFSEHGRTCRVFELAVAEQGAEVVITDEG
jgi:homoserine kinase